MQRRADDRMEREMRIEAALARIPTRLAFWAAPIVGPPHDASGPVRGRACPSSKVRTSDLITNA